MKRLYGDILPEHEMLPYLYGLRERIIVSPDTPNKSIFVDVGHDEDRDKVSLSIIIITFSYKQLPVILTLFF